jgi:hypothetical protein
MAATKRSFRWGKVSRAFRGFLQRKLLAFWSFNLEFDNFRLFLPPGCSVLFHLQLSYESLIACRVFALPILEVTA